MNVETQRKIAFGLDNWGLYDRPQRFVVVSLATYLTLWWLRPEALWDSKTGIQRRTCWLGAAPAAAAAKDQPTCSTASAELIAVVVGLASVLAF